MEGSGKIVAGILALIVIVAGIFWFVSDSDSDDDTASDATTSQTTEATDSEEAAPAAQNIVELAQATDALSTLVSAVVEAELVETLSGEGPFTVFAPTNDAFAAALEALDITAEELLAREDLGDILTFHVVAGEALSTDLSDGQELTTVQGGTLTVEITEAGVFVGGAQVVQPDVDASNGVVHVIDTVLLPS